MFRDLFEGETSSLAELYYNNIQARILIPSNSIYTKYVYQKKHLEEDPSRSKASIRYSYIRLILLYCKALLILTFITYEYIVLSM
jgi:hypothetical protein